jgi:hypothetical protein
MTAPVRFSVTLVNGVIALLSTGFNSLLIALFKARKASLTV